MSATTAAAALSLPVEPRQAWTVSKVVQAADRTLREKTGPLWVRGEVSGWKRASSGHCYFTLKDDRAELCCTLWKQVARALPMLPENGMQVEVYGQLGIYPRRGQFQLDISRVESTGAGGLWQLARERLLRQLRGEGLLDEARKRPLPDVPERVGIVTSAQSAALQDMHRVLRRRAWWVPVLVSHCGVEGAESAPEIAAALRRFGRAREACPVDVVIVARGGGSMESLWGFNMEPVARAIAECPVPVISAVGHETDYTVADLVADYRAATPTAGAEHAVPDGREVAQRVVAFPAEARLRVERAAARVEERAHAVREALDRGVAQRLALLGAGLDAAAHHLEARSPRVLVERDVERAAQAEAALHDGMRRRLDALEHALASGAEGLDARSPLRVLARGYALVSDADSGHAVRSVRGVRPGQPLRVRLADGTFTARAEGAPELSSPDPSRGHA